MDDVKRKNKDRYEKNTGIVIRAQFNYVYTPSSSVFHRNDCPIVLRAQTINGSIYYDTAAKNRRPCKVCRPDLAPKVLSSKSGEFEIRGVEKHNNEPCVSTVVLGKPIYIHKGRLVGFCHNKMHRGHLTARLLKEHMCIEKGCWYFEKYENAPYWQEKEKLKRQKNRQRDLQKAKQSRSEQLKSQIQSFANEQLLPVMIVRVDDKEQGTFKVFYVSDFPRNDCRDYYGLVAKIKSVYSHKKITLVHIKDTDGHYVTIDEYLEIKR